MRATSIVSSRYVRPRESHLAGRQLIPWLVAMVSLLAAQATAALAEERVFRIEVHAVSTMMLTTNQVLAGDTNVAPATIGGELRLPVVGEDRLPVVVLVHGAGGVYGNENTWAEEFNRLGVAVFILDSFTGRGFIDPARNVGQTKDAAAVSGFVMIADAYRALALLSKHPRIDPKRIALMGFSRGGVTALYAALDRFHRQYAPEDVAFAAYVALYPLCNYVLRQDGDVSDRPIRVFHGADDDITPAAPCRAYVERLRRGGKDVQMTEYLGVYHAFDLAVLPAPMNYPELRSFGRCFFEEREAGKLVNRETGMPVSANDSCVSPGATLGYDAKADAATKKAVKELLINTFGLKQQ